MNTAIIIGQGPEVAALLERAGLLSDDLILFRTNVSGATPETVSLPMVDLFDLESARETLLACNVTRIIMIGSLKPANPDVGKGKSFALLKQLILRIVRGEDANCATRRHVRSLFKSDFEFPEATSVLPFLFLADDPGNQPKT